MNQHFLAVCLLGAAWFALSVAMGAGYAAARRRTPLLAAVTAIAALLLAALLASAGADLW